MYRIYLYSESKAYTDMPPCIKTVGLVSALEKANRLVASLDRMVVDNNKNYLLEYEGKAFYTPNGFTRWVACLEGPLKLLD